MSGSASAEYVDGREVSADLFSLLGVTPIRGRAFRSDEDRLGATPVAIISYGLWQRLYGGDTAAIGMPLVFEGETLHHCRRHTGGLPYRETKWICLRCSARMLHRVCRIGKRTVFRFGRVSVPAQRWRRRRRS